MRPQIDERDKGILAERFGRYLEIDGARVGDWVEMLDGTTRRFTHDWGDGLQVTSGAYPGDSSFYFGRGYVSYSGGLDPAIPRARLVDTGTLKQGAIWFFHHDSHRAHNGVYTTALFRVFRERAAQ